MARFELDYLLAAVPHPYVAVMDGITSECKVVLGSVNSLTYSVYQWAAVLAFQ